MHEHGSPVVAIIDHDGILRQTLEALLTIELGVVVVGAATLDLVSMLLVGRIPDVVLVGTDLSTPDGSTDLMAAVGRSFLNPAIIVLSGLGGGWTVRDRAAVILDKPVDAKALVKAIERALVSRGYRDISGVHDDNTGPR